NVVPPGASNDLQGLVHSIIAMIFNGHDEAISRPLIHALLEINCGSFDSPLEIRCPIPMPVIWWWPVGKREDSCMEFFCGLHMLPHLRKNRLLHDGRMLIVETRGLVVRYRE